MNARTRPWALLVFLISGWLCGITTLVVTNDTNRTASLVAGLLFSLGVAMGVVLSRALDSITWRFPVRRAVVAFALLAIAYPVGVVVVNLARAAHDALFPSMAGNLGAGVLAGSGINTIMVGTGLRLLTGRWERSLPTHMMFTPPAVVLLGMILPDRFRDSLGVSVLFVAMNAFLTFLCGVWLVRGASLKSDAA